MSDNRPRFTVKVESSTWTYMDSGDTSWWVTVRDVNNIIEDRIDEGPFPTEAEANKHADMILAALQGATRE